MNLIDVLASWIGGSIGTLPNPWIVASGYIVAKYHPLNPHFWIRFVLSSVACIFLSLMFSRIVDGPDVSLSLAKVVPWTTLAVFWASLFFLAIRRPSRRVLTEPVLEEDCSSSA
ncbi:MAG: hypothetical protein J7493_08375 [Porphyrobacter sp.]|nr:hypothetical protein [Porphyrobacter sp.]